MTMNAQSFSAILQKPNLLKNHSFSELQNLALRHPYFSAINALIAIKAHRENDGSYEHYLSQAAIRVPDRKRLYHLIHSENKEIRDAFIEPAVIAPNENAVATIQLTEEMTSSGESADAQRESLILISIPEEQEKSVVKGGEPEILTQPKEEKPFELPGAVEVVEALKSIGETKEAVREETPPERSQEVPEAKMPKDDRHSFAEWLSLIKQNRSAESPVLREIQASDSTDAIEFSKGNVSAKDESDLAKKAKESLSDDMDWVTETLAKIYELQKKYDKAEDAYRMLSLKFPDKKAYFAQRIENLKKFKA